MKRLKYSKIKNYFFLAGIAVSIVFGLINFFIFDGFNGAVLLCTGISIFACICIFYRFNLGVIAIIRGDFGKPPKKDKRFVDYEKPIVKDVQALKELIDYGKSSLLVYKMNTREIYQLVKFDGRLLLNKCTIDKGLITDFTKLSEMKSGRGHIFVDYKIIDRINYLCTPTNYYLPVINIITNHKQYRFIGLLEELTPESIKLFFDDIPDIKINIKSTPDSPKILSARREKDKRDFNLNFMILLEILFIPYLMYLHTFSNGFMHSMVAIYSAISILLLIVFLLLPIFNSKYYTIGFIDEAVSIKGKQNTAMKYSGKKDIKYLVTLIPLYVVLFLTRVETYVNLAWYSILVAVFTAIFMYAFFRSNPVKVTSFKNIAVKIVISCFIFLLSGCAIVTTVNNLVIFNQSQSSHNVLDKSWHSSRNGEAYYAKIRYYDKECWVTISQDEYESNSNILDIEKVRGLLGVEYIAVSND